MTGRRPPAEGMPVREPGSGRRRPASRSGIGRESLLFSGGSADGSAPTISAGAGVEDTRPREPDYGPHDDSLHLPDAAPGPEPDERPDPRELRALIPPAEDGRAIDDWGRSQRVFDLVEPLLDFYYRYWFRVETEGIERIPSDGGALLVSNHSGALPPDAPMIAQAIHHEHDSPRPLYALAEHWFKGYPGVGLLTNKLGVVPAHPANAQRLLGDEQRLALVFPEGQKATRKLYWQRYQLRRFGRGGFVRTAIRAGVPIVPIAVLGAEESMPIFAHVPLLQRLTGLIYFPVTHAFPQFGLAAALMYLPAKFRIHVLEPVDLSEHTPDDADDPALVQGIAEQVRSRIQSELDGMVAARRSVWFG